jgi:hypothetical protein
MSSIDEAELVRRYREDHLSLAELALHIGWSPGIVRKILVAHGVSIRTAWAHNAVDCPGDEVRRLYVDERLSLGQVATLLGCSQGVVRRRLVAAGITRREAGGHIRFQRHDFSGRLEERAYLIGFRIGDLHVALQGSRTILVKCTSTRPEQVELFKSLFGGYGHVYTDEESRSRRERQSIGMQVGLNLTFEFLLPKHSAIPQWIRENDEPFFAFLAGYIDAEGYFRTYFHTNQPGPLGRLEIRAYDATLLQQLGHELNARGIKCPPAQMCVPAGYTNSSDVVSNRDLWRLGVHRRRSLRDLITRLDPYIHHARRRRDMFRVFDICKL